MLYYSFIRVCVPKYQHTSSHGLQKLRSCSRYQLRIIPSGWGRCWLQGAHKQAITLTSRFTYIRSCMHTCITTYIQAAIYSYVCIADRIWWLRHGLEHNNIIHMSARCCVVVLQGFSLSSFYTTLITQCPEPAQTTRCHGCCIGNRVEGLRLRVRGLRVGSGPLDDHPADRNLGMLFGMAGLAYHELHRRKGCWQGRCWPETLDSALVSLLLLFASFHERRCKTGAASAF